METIKILQNLEERFDYALYVKVRGKENHLSDIVWAMCQSDKNFLKTFFEFCFIEITEEANIKLYGIDREMDHNTNGRSDFNIYTSKGTYIIESKIGDTAINVQKYLPIVDGESARITYIVPKKWNGNIDELGIYNVKVVTWEKFIKKIKDDYDDKFTSFIRKAELILDVQDKYMPPIESVEEEINIIEDFKKQFFSEDIHVKLDCNWTDKYNPYYGYNCWASVWFGIGYNPLKGVFFCFTIGKGGDKKPDNLNHLGPFQKVIKLWNEDMVHYFEVAIDDIKNMTTDILDEAFREFAKDIKVITNENVEVPLLTFIKYKRQE